MLGEKSRAGGQSIEPREERKKIKKKPQAIQALGNWCVADAHDAFKSSSIFGCNASNEWPTSTTLPSRLTSMKVGMPRTL